VREHRVQYPFLGRAKRELLPGQSEIPDRAPASPSLVREMVSAGGSLANAAKTRLGQRPIGNGDFDDGSGALPYDGPNQLSLERAEANDVVAWLGNHARVRRMQVNARFGNVCRFD